MARIICRNTFIDVTSGDDEGRTKSCEYSQLHQRGRRSRSAESLRFDPREESSDEVAELQLVRLNSLLGLAPTSPLLRTARVTQQWQETDVTSLSNLMLLRKRLKQALVPTRSWSKLQTMCSNASISTMCPASEDAGDNMDHAESECGSAQFYMNIEECPASSTPQTPQTPLTPPTQSPQVQPCEWPAHHYTHFSCFPALLELNEPAEVQSSRSKVPRTLDLSAAYERSANAGSPPTTLMLRSIPNRYTQREFILELEEMGFSDAFDFVYIPMDKCTRGNLGYAFVNLVNPSWAEKCMAVFQDYRFKKHRDVSSKISTVSVAHIQGLENNLAHYSKAAVSSSRHKQRRPVVLGKASMFAADSTGKFVDAAWATKET